ncbi:hypothetical protein IAT38_000806 [Cryptococcus sp. DSM 104549]
MPMTAPPSGRVSSSTYSAPPLPSHQQNYPPSMFASHTQLALEQLKLSHILNGETCPPISFADFAAFVTNKDHTTENLLFVLWYRDYRERYGMQPEEVRARIPVPSTRLRDRYDPFGYLERARRAPTAPASAVSGELESDLDGDAESKPSLDPEHPTLTLPFLPPCPSRPHSPAVSCSSTDERTIAPPIDQSTTPAPCECGCNSKHQMGPSKLYSMLPWRRGKRSGEEPEGGPCPAPASAPAIAPVPAPAVSTTSRSIISHPRLPPPGTSFLPTSDQPMREQAHRAFATFLRKGGSKELAVSDELREFAKGCLGTSTAPESFLPIYEEIYATVESQSLPRFLENAKSNINRPKQLFWYFVGFIDFLIGIIVFLILSLLLPRQPYAYRALRLFSIIFISFGVMQAYSAYRGFCTQVWGRSHRQVRPWEMDDLDDDEEMRVGGEGEGDGDGTDGEGEGAGGEGVEMRGAQSEVEPKTLVSHPSSSPERRTARLDSLRLPDEVHPLSNLGGIADSTEDIVAHSPSASAMSSKASLGQLSPAIPLLAYSPVPPAPAPAGPPTSAPSPALTQSQTPEQALEAERRERRQAEIRRATVKVPSAQDAFPIDELARPVPAVPATLGQGLNQGQGQGDRRSWLGGVGAVGMSRGASAESRVIGGGGVDEKRRREISPFEVDGEAEAGEAEGKVGFGEGVVRAMRKSRADDPVPELEMSDRSDTLSVSVYPTTPSSKPATRPSRPRAPTATSTAGESLTARRSAKDISALLSRLRRTVSYSSAPDDPTARDEKSRAPRHSRTLTRTLTASSRPADSLPKPSHTLDPHAPSRRWPRSKRDPSPRKKKIHVFGPERLVEDPRIKKVYRDIKRDILIVGCFVGGLWAVVCLAVPCAGLV